MQTHQELDRDGFGDGGHELLLGYDGEDGHGLLIEQRLAELCLSHWMRGYLRPGSGPHT